MYLTRLLPCFLLAIFLLGTVAQANVQLKVFGASNSWWIAVDPINDDGATTTVELKDASGSFTRMMTYPNWDYFALTSASGQSYALPLTFRLTSASGAQIVVDVTSIAPDGLVDTGSSYASPTAPTEAPTDAPTPAPTDSATSAPTEAPTPAPTSPPTQAPTDAPTSAPTQPATQAPTQPPTQAPTQPATQAPTQPPTQAPTPPPTAAPTQPPTQAPTQPPTQKPTLAPTQAPTPAPTQPSNVDLCAVPATSAEPLKILVPLYVYPGSAWTQLINAANKAQIIAIINPNSGPLSSVDSSYSSYMNQLHAAGIEMIGYVHTTYGQRSISDVEADINLWASKYPLITGIFFDEASADSSELSYYTSLYNFVMSKSGYNQVILNPGIQPDQGYLAISTSIVIFEDYASNLAGRSFSSWVTCAPNASAKSGYKYKFSGIAHTATSDIATGILSSMSAKGIGLVYVTDGAGGCCTYNNLVSYFAQEASDVQALN